MVLLLKKAVNSQSFNAFPAGCRLVSGLVIAQRLPCLSLSIFSAGFVLLI